MPESPAAEFNGCVLVERDRLLAVLTTLVEQAAARRGEDPSRLLTEALELAMPTQETQRLVPVALARAEAAWLAGRLGEIVAEVDRAWDSAVSHPRPWDLGELCWWLCVAGVRRVTPVPVALPFALMLEGKWQAAAEKWQALDCPLWAAAALSRSPELAAARQALELVDEIGAPATRQAILRDRHALGLAVPRGPRPASQANPSGLTAREIDVLRLLVGGLSNADVADHLFLSEKTVGHHTVGVDSQVRTRGPCNDDERNYRHGVVHGRAQPRWPGDGR